MENIHVLQTSLTSIPPPPVDCFKVPQLENSSTLDAKRMFRWILKCNSHLLNLNEHNTVYVARLS